jgi:class 3 adenylate cyclase/tetratricopeptide (TPR) repeat protein
MTFEEALAQVRELLERKGRVSYRALKLQFNLDDDYLEGLKDELIEAEHVAADEGGKVLVWMGAAPVSSSKFQVSSFEFRVPSSTQPLAPSTQPPSSYTPPHLAERIRAEQTALEARGATDGERKTITILFADLKGSTALIEGLDPEEARAIIDPALQLMMDAVHRYEGYVAQALGDGILALFGAPLAYEDHPQRALYAALRMQEEMRRYADTLRAKGHPPLLMRVGVNTGEVVVRSIRKEDLHTDYVPVGHSINLAARMEQLAAPGSTLVTAYTHKLTDGYFEFKNLGQTKIKGVEEPLHVYEVLGAGPLRTRLQVAVQRGLTRFVGRQSELDQLKKALEQVNAGHGQIVGTMGEPGLGKSRLFYEFKLTSQSGCVVLEAYSVSHGKASPYLPVIELPKGYFDITMEDDERKRREKIGGKVLMLDRSLEDTLPYLYALLGIEEQPSPLQQMDAQIRRRRTFDALKKLFLRESLNQPLILIFEDLHWIDSETQGFLDVLSESVASAKVLLLVNYRPEYRHEWGQKTYYTQLRLAPFSKEEAEELLTFLLGNDAGLKVLKQPILDKTEGTPFFMEEVVQTLAEEGTLVGERSSYRLTHHAPALHIPTTVQGVLAARIDRLAPAEKELLQQLAVIGREFPLSLVRQVIPQPEEELYRILSSLQHKEFLYEQPAFPEVEYIFKHALTQEVAYGTVLQERRKALHEKIAQAIEAIYHMNLEDHYSELAHHYNRSGNAAKAVEYLSLAGQQAARHSANADAINHLTTALELLKTLPDTAVRARHELTLHLSLGASLIATKGYSAAEVEHTYTRAQELCPQVGEPLQVSQVLFGLHAFYAVRGNHTAALALGEQFLTVAHRQQDSTLSLVAHTVVGVTLLFLGDFTPAQAHLDQAWSLYNPEHHRDLAYLMGLDPGLLALVFAAKAFWYRGYPDQALERAHHARSVAQVLSHPFSVANVLYGVALVHLFRREGQDAQAQAEALLTLAHEYGFAQWLGWGTSLQGWALVERAALSGTREQEEAGLVQTREGLAVLRATGAELWVPLFLGSLAQGYGQGGQAEEGLKVIAEALVMVEKNEECWNEAELYRLKGELTLQKEAGGWRLETGPSSPQTSSLKPPVPSGVEQEAEEYFLRAIDIAQKQQAKSLELRATVSLARLWQQQGKVAEAHQMLSEIYNWFTEGFETKDVQEAKTLLEELS